MSWLEQPDCRTQRVQRPPAQADVMARYGNAIECPAPRLRYSRLVLAVAVILIVSALAPLLSA
jgi:hypothetical protein